MISVEAQSTLAAHTVDHLFPRGTKNDNYTHPDVVRKLIEKIPTVTLLDLGCSGGGFVKSFLDQAHLAVGIEGSDYSLVRQRAEWATIPDYLFVADITQPLQVKLSGYPASFDVVSAWEVLEHIAESDLPALLDNIDRHLSPRGFFLGSISGVSDFFEGHEYHATIHPKEWWDEVFASRGYESDDAAIAYFDRDWVRGGPGTDSFGVVYKRQGSPSLVEGR